MTNTIELTRDNICITGKIQPALKQKNVLEVPFDIIDADEKFGVNARDDDHKHTDLYGYINVETGMVAMVYIVESGADIAIHTYKATETEKEMVRQLTDNTIRSRCGKSLKEFYLEAVK